MTQSHGGTLAGLRKNIADGGAERKTTMGGARDAEETAASDTGQTTTEAGTGAEKGAETMTDQESRDIQHQETAVEKSRRGITDLMRLHLWAADRIIMLLIIRALPLLQ
jgi:hypothetical protein